MGATFALSPQHRNPHSVWAAALSERGIERTHEEVAHVPFLAQAVVHSFEELRNSHKHGELLAPVQTNRRWSLAKTDPLVGVLSKPGKSGTTEEAVSRASTLLFDALHTQRESEKIVASITAIEMVLSDSTGFRPLERRVKMLVGCAYQNQEFIDDVFKARHDIVHQGATPKIHSSDAVRLAIRVIRVCAGLADQFGAKQLLIDWLDALKATEQVLEHLPGEQREFFEREFALEPLDYLPVERQSSS